MRSRQLSPGKHYNYLGKNILRQGWIYVVLHCILLHKTSELLHKNQNDSQNNCDTSHLCRVIRSIPQVAGCMQCWWEGTSVNTLWNLEDNQQLVESAVREHCTRGLQIPLIIHPGTACLAVHYLIWWWLSLILHLLGVGIFASASALLRSFYGATDLPQIPQIHRGIGAELLVFGRRFLRLTLIFFPWLSGGTVSCTASCTCTLCGNKLSINTNAPSVIFKDPFLNTSQHLYEPFHSSSELAKNILHTSATPDPLHIPRRLLVRCQLNTKSSNEIGFRNALENFERTDTVCL